MKTLKWRDCKTDADRFAYHTHVYAWRLFRGHAQPGETTSPNDPTGQWYDADAVRAELANMQAEANRNRPKSTFRFTDREVRTRLQWARDHGYQTWNDFLDAVQQGRERILPYRNWYTAEFSQTCWTEGWQSLGDALGNAFKQISPDSLPKPTTAINWLEVDQEGKLVEPWRAYGKPQPKLAPRSRRASYPDDPT